MKKPNILVISPGILPVPAVLGGAIESLIEHMYKGYKNDNEGQKVTFCSIEIPRVRRHQNQNDTFAMDDFVFIARRKFLSYCVRPWKYIIRKCGLNEDYLNIYLIQVLYHIARSDYDTIIVENQINFGSIIRFVFPKKLILHLHNDKINSDAKYSQKNLSAFDEVITVSEYIKQQVETADDTRRVVKVLHNVVDYKAYRHDNIESGSSCKPGADKLKIVYVGRLDPQKGVLQLIKAFKNIKMFNIELIIVGGRWFSDDSVDDYTQALIKESKVSISPISFTGFLPQNEIPQFLKSSDICVVPSMHNEAAPLTVLEAQAAGCTVVGSNCGGIPELIYSEESFLFEPHHEEVEFIKNLEKALMDAIKYKIHNQNFRLSQKYCERYDATLYYKNLIRLI